MHFSVIPVINTIFSIFSDNPVDLTCPKSAISSETRTGSFPKIGLSQFPASYDCGVEFEIPSGYVLKYRIQTNVEEPGDKIVIRDSLSSLHEFTSASSIFYAPAEHVKISIKTESSSSSFHFTWEYIDVTNYEEVKRPVGKVLPLNLTSNHYYRFERETKYRSDSISQIQLRTGSLSGGLDSSLSKIFVYDGENLKAKFVGTLDQIASTTEIFKSTGNSLTLVNFYRLPSDSYVIANEHYRISYYANYDLVILSKEKAFRRRMKSPSRLSATTFYCIDSEETYITDLKFLGQGTQRAISFAPLDTSQGSYDLLTYNVPREQIRYGERFSSQRLPQQILTNSFTMGFDENEVEVELKSGPLENYSQVVPGRRGKVASPSKWNPTAPSVTTFYTTFTASENVRFVIDTSYVHLENPQDKLLVEIGTGRVTPQFYDLKNGYGIGRQAVGKYMVITFIGTSEKSDFVINYHVEDVPITTTWNPNEKASIFKTASMSSSATFGFSVLALLVAILL